MKNSSIKLETLRVNVWKMGKLIEKLTQDNELMKCQIIELESIEKETEKNGVEAVEISPERILTRRGANSKKLALAQAMNIYKK